MRKIISIEAHLSREFEAYNIADEEIFSLIEKNVIRYLTSKGWGVEIDFIAILEKTAKPETKITIHIK